MPAIKFESLWSVTKGDPAKRFPSLTQSLSTEIAVIGGGITGLTCALLLGRAGKKVTVIEAGLVGSGTTGRSTGNLYSLVDQNLSQLISKWGKKTARNVIAARTAAIDFIASLVEENKLGCDFVRTEFNYFTDTLSVESKEFLEREKAAALDLGLAARLRPSAKVPFHVASVLEVKDQAQFHPLLYVQGLSERLPERVHLYENSPALRIDTKAGRIDGDGWSLKADQIVMATHTPKGIHSVQFRLSPVREHGLAAPLKGNGFPGIFWSVDNPKRSVRTLSRGDQSYVLVIGDKFKTGHKVNTPQENWILNRYLERRFRLKNERYWWAAQSYRSADGIPFIGRGDNGTYYATGFATDGLVYGTLGAMIIADEILGRENPWASLFTPKRVTPLKSACAMLNEGADNLFQYAKRAAGMGTVSLETIQPGHGGVVDYKGEKIAVFRDERGKLHTVSAICTHMKCMVSFNRAEKTWDCPCHASRFTFDGNVIEGPALAPLPIKELPEP